MRSPSSWVSRIHLASGSRAPFIHGGAAAWRSISAWIGHQFALAGERHRRSARRRDVVCAWPSTRIRQWPNGSTISKDSGPAPRRRGWPSAPVGSCTAPGPTALNTRPSANATLIWMSWVSHWSATASTPTAGHGRWRARRPRPTRSPTRASRGRRACVAQTSPSSSSKPPVRSIATSTSGSSRACGSCSRRTGCAPRRGRARTPRVRGGCSRRGARRCSRPPPLHARLELVGVTGSPSQS